MLITITLPPIWPPVTELECRFLRLLRTNREATPSTRRHRHRPNFTATEIRFVRECQKKHTPKKFTFQTFLRDVCSKKDEKEHQFEVCSRSTTTRLAKYAIKYTFYSGRSRLFSDDRLIPRGAVQGEENYYNKSIYRGRSKCFKYTAVECISRRTRCNCTASATPQCYGFL